jgi:hypothetical protein
MFRSPSGIYSLLTEWDDTIGGPGLASSLIGTKNMSAMAIAIDAMMVAVLNMSFMFPS